MPSLATAERRQFGRRESSIAASVIVYGRAPLACTVRNCSTSGALLEFAEAAPSSATFHLVIPERSIDILCQARHRAQRSLGVAFLGGHAQQFIDAFGPRAPVADEAQSLAPRPDATRHSATAASGPPASALIAALVDGLAAVPEFGAAEFRTRPGSEAAEVFVFQRTAKRGAWRQRGNRLVWQASRLGAEEHEVESIEAALHKTMKVVLSVLQLRRARMLMLMEQAGSRSASAPA
jgi:hypothetical protein